jgi:uncharacterized Zn finger protein
MESFSYYRHYTPARPLPVERGIAARSRRGAIGETWWSQRFIELLESFGVGSRLKRGRSYARAGQVVELEIEPGLVLASVQGTRYSPYRVRIQVKVLSEHQWRRAEKAMAAQALPLALLLAGEMPRDVEELFAACKLTLFPKSYGELRASCSCPDWENPCKHVAAAYYILAERFDEDPFLIFAWRGRTKEELLGRLRARRDRPSGRATAAAEPAPANAHARTAPLSERLADFWRCGPELAGFRANPLAGEVPDALLRQLGPAPAETRGRNVAELLAPAYTELAQHAERRALGA